MKKIYYKILENGFELYNLKKATEDSAGFDLVAAIEKKIIIKLGTASTVKGESLKSSSLSSTRVLQLGQASHVHFILDKQHTCTPSWASTLSTRQSWCAGIATCHPDSRAI